MPDAPLGVPADHKRKAGLMATTKLSRQEIEDRIVLLLRMATADNELADSEAEFIVWRAQTLGVNDLDFKALLQKATTEGPPPLPKDGPGKIMMLFDILYLVSADGKILNSEALELEKIAKTFGLDMEQLTSLSAVFFMNSDHPEKMESVAEDLAKKMYG